MRRNRRDMKINCDVKDKGKETTKEDEKGINEEEKDCEEEEMLKGGEKTNEKELEEEEE